MKISLAQLNVTVGSLKDNTALIEEAVVKAYDDQSDLVVFSELAITGYPPRDFLTYPHFLTSVEKSLTKIETLSKTYLELGILVGAPVQEEGKLYNATLLYYQGSRLHTQYKSLLPSYDVFDETRYFTPASEITIIPFKEEVLGISICEDAWAHLYKETTNPIQALCDQGATVLINMSASPFEKGKESVRLTILKDHVKKYKVPMIMVNQVGGNDELIFDGNSLALDKGARLVAHLASFKEDYLCIDLKNTTPLTTHRNKNHIEDMCQGLVLGVRDYVRKCDFDKVLVGLSGGIDSAVTFAIAVRALGLEKVLGVGLPSDYSSQGSIDDAKLLAKNLGSRFELISIKDIVSSFNTTLSPLFKGQKHGLAEENIQARTRGNLLMAISNKFGYLLLSTGNKSELAVGYCTLYGDMCGGLAVLSDVFKTEVYQLADYLNKEKPVIPITSITKAPSAELRPNQTDQDSLPEYDTLDQILHLLLEEQASIERIINAGFEPALVQGIAKKVHLNEYKRRQATPGLKLSAKAFGIGRRMPIAACFDEF